MIEVNNVNKKYGRKQVLKDFSFTAEKGEITCLIGINGVGKTTIMKAIMALTPINSGAPLQSAHERKYQCQRMVHPSVNNRHPVTNPVAYSLLLYFLSISIAMLMIYVFFIWYRDWFGKNTFIYRLFMLPTERIAIYFAKLTTIMLLVLGLIALQILLILMEKQIVNKIIPIDLQSNFSIYTSSTSCSLPVPLRKFQVGKSNLYKH